MIQNPVVLCLKTLYLFSKKAGALKVVPVDKFQGFLAVCTSKHLHVSAMGPFMSILSWHLA